jgi:hypothetical protein
MSDSPSPTVTASTSKLDRFVAQYRHEHRHPVNHFLHVGVGWPLCALGVIVLPFRPLWTAGFFLAGYALMFFGHFAFEKNTPTIFKHPTTPFVMSWAVIRGLGSGLWRLTTLKRSR